MPGRQIYRVSALTHTGHRRRRRRRRHLIDSRSRAQRVTPDCTNRTTRNEPRMESHGEIWMICLLLVLKKEILFGCITIFMFILVWKMAVTLPFSVVISALECDTCSLFFFSCIITMFYRFFFKLRRKKKRKELEVGVDEEVLGTEDDGDRCEYAVQDTRWAEISGYTKKYETSDASLFIGMMQTLFHQRRRRIWWRERLEMNGARPVALAPRACTQLWAKRTILTFTIINIYSAAGRCRTLEPGRLTTNHQHPQQVNCFKSGRELKELNETHWMDMARVYPTCERDETRERLGRFIRRSFLQAQQQIWSLYQLIIQQKHLVNSERKKKTQRE